LWLLAWQVAVNAFFNHVVPNASANEIRGPFSLASYALPVLTIGPPFLVSTPASLSTWAEDAERILVSSMSVVMLLSAASSCGRGRRPGSTGA
jgi:hypothetical protein